MTLRTIESEFSDQLLAQTHNEFPLDLTLDGPIMTKLHPKLIWTKLLFMHKQEMASGVKIPGWNHASFVNAQAANASFPQIKQQFVGKPYSVFKFLENCTQDAIIDFPPLGAIVLSKSKLLPQNGNELHHYLLPIWTNYAVSPELWGPQGKWTQFHARLQTLFTKHNLLRAPTSLGYYSLAAQASLLGKHGYCGSSVDNTYLLVLPWTFSLGDLKKLEDIIQQEF